MVKVSIKIEGVKELNTMLNIRNRKYREHAGKFAEYMRDKIKTIYLDEASDSGDLAESVKVKELTKDWYQVTIGDAKTYRAKVEKGRSGINYAIPVEYGIKYVRKGRGRFASGRKILYAANKSGKLEKDSWNIVKRRRGINAIPRGIHSGREKAYRELGKKK